MKKPLLILCILFCLTSCSLFEENTDANLTVYVYGALSGNPRDDIHVGVYGSEEDADDQENQIKGQVTDADGKVTFVGLSTTRIYYIRASAVLAKTIRSTGTLKEGDNYMEVPIL